MSRTEQSGTSGFEEAPLITRAPYSKQQAAQMRGARLEAWQQDKELDALQQLSKLKELDAKLQKKARKEMAARAIARVDNAFRS